MRMFSFLDGIWHFFVRLLQVWDLLVCSGYDVHLLLMQA
jgi:hypothetical protein